MSQFKKNEYRSEIDGLRAVAVLAVIVAHVNSQALPGGYLGVDMFFVISGYVVTASLINRKSGFLPIAASSTENISNSFLWFILQFYSRRIRRLLPALLSSAVLTGIGMVFLIPSQAESKPSFLTGNFALTGLSNNYLYYLSTDYFGQTAQLNTFTHTWSLSVEEQFYFFYPTVFWVTASSFRLRVLCLIILTILSMFFFIMFIMGKFKGGFSAGYFLIPSRFWELGCGCIVSTIYYEYELSSSLQHSLSLEVVNFFVVFGLGFIFCTPEVYIYVTAPAIVMLTCLLIICVKPESKIYSLLTSNILQFIGKISYSLYLYHWMVLSLSRWGYFVSLTTIFWQMLFIFFLATLSYYYIETPCKNPKWLSCSHTQPCCCKTFLSAFVALIFSYLILWLLYQQHDTIRHPFIKTYNTTINTRNVSNEECLQLENSSDITAGGGNLIGLPNAKRCHVPEKNLEQTCLTGAKGIYSKVLLIGDSHASNQYYALSRAIAGQSLTFSHLVSYSIIGGVLGENDSFKIVLKSNLRFQNLTKENDIIVFGFYYYRINTENTEKFYSNLKYLGNFLKKKRAYLLLIQDTPNPLKRTPSEILNENNPQSDMDTLTLAEHKQRTKMQTDIYEKVVEELNSTYIRTFGFDDVLCRNDICSPFIPCTHKLMYGDSSGHLTKDTRYLLVDKWEMQLSTFVKGWQE